MLRVVLTGETEVQVLLEVCNYDVGNRDVARQEKSRYERAVMLGQRQTIHSDQSMKKWDDLLVDGVSSGSTQT